jgi:hypothetical protein
LNKYAYVNDDPLNKIDPSGQELVDMLVTMGWISVRVAAEGGAAYVRGREATAAEFKPLFTEFVYLNMVFGWFQPTLWAAEPFSEVYTLILLAIFDITPWKVVEKGIEGKLKTYNKVVTGGGYNRVTAMAMGVPPNPSGWFPDFSYIALDPLRTRYSILAKLRLAGKSLIANDLFTGRRYLDFLEMDALLGLVPY